LWAALGHAHAADSDAALRLGTLGWYFALADRVSEGRRFLERSVSATRDDGPIELRIEQLADLCYIATEELDLDAALMAGERALALAVSAAAPWPLGFAQLMLGLAVAQAGDVERAATLMEDAANAFEAAGDNWGAAATSLIRAIGAAHAGDVSAAAAMTTTARRHADAIGYDAFRVPTFLLEAWVAQRHKDGAATTDAYGRALELAGRVGFGDHAAFALVGLGSHALAYAAHATSIAAYARVGLAQVAAASGDGPGARQLYQQVLEWSQTERPHEARESLFLALAGDPATVAERGLAELGETALT
jgi:hypothetical protein